MKQYNRRIWVEKHICKYLYKLVHNNIVTSCIPECIAYKLWEWDYRVSYNFGTGDD